MSAVTGHIREIGNPTRLNADQARGRHPLCKPMQMGDWRQYWQTVKHHLQHRPVLTRLPVHVGVKEDGVSCTIRSSRSGVTLAYRTQYGKDIHVLDTDILPDWAIALGTSWSAEFHATMRGKPLGFCKMSTLISMWVKHGTIPAGVNLFLSVFALQRIQLSCNGIDMFTGGGYDDETNTDIIARLGTTSKYGVTLRPVQCDKYAVMLDCETNQLLFSLNGKTVAKCEEGFRKILLDRAHQAGHEGYVVKMDDYIFCPKKGANSCAWFEDWAGKPRLKSAIKCKSEYAMQLVIVRFMPVGTDPTGEKLILLCKRNGNLVYAGTIRHSYQAPLECIPKTPLSRYKRVKDVYKFFNTYAIHPDYLTDFRECFEQVTGCFTWVTSKRNCAVGLKSKLKLCPLDFAKVDDTKEVAEKNPHWAQVIQASTELDDWIASTKPRKKRKSSSTLSDEEDEEEIPEPLLLVKRPPPRPKSDFDRMVEAMIAARVPAPDPVQPRPRSPSLEPEDYYNMEQDLDDQRSLAESTHSETQCVPDGGDDDIAGPNSTSQQTLVYHPGSIALSDASDGTDDSEEEQDQDSHPLPGLPTDDPKVQTATPCPDLPPVPTPEKEQQAVDQPVSAKPHQPQQNHPLEPEEVLNNLADALGQIALNIHDRARWINAYVLVNDILEMFRTLEDPLKIVLSLDWLNLGLHPDRSMYHRFAFLVRQPAYYRTQDMSWFFGENQARLRYKLLSVLRN